MKIKKAFLSFIFGIVMLFMTSGGAFAAPPNLFCVFENGADTSYDTSTITPDGDGQADVLKIHFWSDTPCYWQIIIDTNRDMTFFPTTDWANPYDWTWGGPGGPVYISANVMHTVMWEAKGYQNMWDKVYPSGIYQIQISAQSVLNGEIQTTPNSSTLPSQWVEIITACCSGTITGTDPFATAEFPVSFMNMEIFNPANQVRYQTMTDTYGKYFINGVRPGTYTLRIDAMSQGFAEQETSVFVDVVPIAYVKNMTLRRGGYLAMNILFSSVCSDTVIGKGKCWKTDGSYQIGGDIEVYPGDTRFLITMGGPERIVPVFSLPPGTYYGHIEIPGYTVYDTGPFVITYGETVTADSIVIKLGRVSGIINRPTGTFGETMFVSLSLQAQKQKKNNISMVATIKGNQGFTNYSVVGINPDTYTATAYIKGFLKNTYPGLLVMNYGSDTTLNPILSLSWSKGSKIDDFISIEGGAPYDPTMVGINVYSPQNDYNFETHVYFDQYQPMAPYRISGLETGVYYLDASFWGFDPIHKIVIVPSDSATIPMPLVLRKPQLKIKGSVTGIDPADSDSILVGCTSLYTYGGQASGTAVFTVDGNYELTGFPSGEYLLYAGSVIPNQYGGPESDGKYATFGTKVFANVGETFVCDIALSAQAGTITGRIVSGNTATMAGKPVYAMPVAFVVSNVSGGLVGRIGPDGVTYRIKGLYTSAYKVFPETNIDTSNDSNYEINPELVSMPEYKIINVSAGSVCESVDFSVGTGSSVSGSIILPEPVMYGEFHADVILRQKKEGPGAQEKRKNITIMAGLQSGTYTLDIVPPGNYILNVFSQWYKNETLQVNITDTSPVTSLNFYLSRGVSVKGKAVDALTGQLVPLAPNESAEGVYVHSEARPWKEGSWRWPESEWDPAEDREKVRLDPAGKFTISNLPEGNYDIVFTCGQQAVGRTYANFTIPNIVVPAYTPGQPNIIDIGEIRLMPGLTITGNVRDTLGNSLPNLKVTAKIGGTHPNSFMALQTKTQSDGFYILRGISADYYYDVIVAGEQGEFDFGSMGAPPADKYETGIRRAVMPGATGVNFYLDKADAYVTGAVTKLDTAPLCMNFESFLPGAVVVLKRAGSPRIADNPMTDGLLTLTTPSDAAGRNYSFTRYGLVPGRYTVKVLADGYSMAMLENVQITSGANTIDILTLNRGATVKGNILKEDGSVVTSDIAGEVVAATFDMKKFAKGTVSIDPTTQEVSGYSVTGLEPFNTYSLVVVGEEVADVFIENARICPQTSDTEILHNIIIADYPPYFHLNVRKPKQDPKFYFKVVSSRPLIEMRAEDALSFTGKGTASNFVMQDDKIEMEAEYLPSGENSFTLNVMGHTQTGKEGFASFKIYIGAAAQVAQKINITSGGQVGVGNGDNSLVDIDQGAIQVNTDTGTAEITIDKVDYMLTAAGAMKLSACAYPFAIPASTSSPGVKMSAYYNIGWNLFGNIFTGTGLTVTLDYDASVANVEDLQVFYYDTATLEWRLEATNRTIDTENHTISVEVNHLSTFGVFTTVFAGGFDVLTTYNYPNPFKPAAHSATNIMVGLPESCKFTVRIYNIAGEMVRELCTDIDGTGGAKNVVAWDGTNDSGQKVASGTYVYIVKTPTAAAVNKIMIIR